MTKKNIIIRSESGLYVMKRKGGSLGFTNLKNATHYENKTEAKKDIKKLLTRGCQEALSFIDLNKR